MGLSRFHRETARVIGLTGWGIDFGRSDGSEVQKLFGFVVVVAVRVFFRIAPLVHCCCVPVTSMCLQFCLSVVIDLGDWGDWR